MTIAGFDWDAGNWAKCGKHGVSGEEIEQDVVGRARRHGRPLPWRTAQAAYRKDVSWALCLFLVFMRRDVGGQTRLRPISARYMHQKEVDHYESQIQAHAVAA